MLFRSATYYRGNNVGARIIRGMATIPVIATTPQEVASAILFDAIGDKRLATALAPILADILFNHTSNEWTLSKSVVVAIVDGIRQRSEIQTSKVLPTRSAETAVRFAS